MDDEDTFVLTSLDDGLHLMQDWCKLDPPVPSLHNSPTSLGEAQIDSDTDVRRSYALINPTLSSGSDGPADPMSVVCSLTTVVIEVLFHLDSVRIVTFLPVC